MNTFSEGTEAGYEGRFVRFGFALVNVHKLQQPLDLSVNPISMPFEKKRKLQVVSSPAIIIDALCMKSLARHLQFELN